MRRVGQDVAFEVPHLRGDVVTACLGVCTEESDLEPAVVRLKTRDQPWQRFFLDVCFAVGEADVEDENDDSFRVVDYAAMFDIHGATVLRAHAVPHGESSRVVVELTSGTLVLAPRSPGLDAGASVSFSPP